MSKNVRSCQFLLFRLVDYTDRREVWVGEGYHTLYKTVYKRIYRARARHLRMTTGKHGMRRPR